MHILSSHNRSEFLACPHLVRFDYAMGAESHEPTLLVKGSSLLLKYIVTGVRLQLVFARFDENLLYGLKIFDDADRGALLWSMCERDEEIKAIAGLARGEECQTFLFNEIAVNVAWSAFAPLGFTADLQAIIDGVSTVPVGYALPKERQKTILERLHNNVLSPDTLFIDIEGGKNWHPVRARYITNKATVSSIDLFDKDEGKQQEQIGIWLTDSLHPTGANHSLQVPNGKQRRELTDIVLSYEYGSIFIESKALSIFVRDELPSRAKLAKDVSAHIAKAVSQLRGGIRRVKSGVPITDVNGNPVTIERTQPIHAIVLIPDMDLIENRADYGRELVAEFTKATGGFLHLMDTAELLRMVQAAEMIAARGQKTTPMMAFDYYLIERAKTAMEVGSLCFEMLIRFTN